MEFTKPRYPVTEARGLLGLGHTIFYARVKEGKLRLQKDGKRSFVTAAELARYIESCDQQTA